MSLILEALRKLDREKAAPERGFLIVGAAGWPARERRLLRPGFAVLAAAAAAAVGLVAWPRQTPAPRTAFLPAPVPAVSMPAAPAPSPPAAPQAAPSPVMAPAVPHDRSEPAPPPESLPAGPAPGADAAPASPAPSPAPTDASAFHLVAISRKDGHPVAMLNDRLVREGDSFDGVRVVRIGEAEVEIEVRGRRLVIGF